MVPGELVYKSASEPCPHSKSEGDFQLLSKGKQSVNLAEVEGS